jgi:hypothetical protein
MSSRIDFAAIAERVQHGRGFFSRDAAIPTGHARIKRIAVELSMADGLAFFPGSNEPNLRGRGFCQLTASDVAAIAPLAAIDHQLSVNQHLVALTWGDGTVVLTTSLPGVDPALPEWWCELAYRMTHTCAHELYGVSA